MVDRTPRIYRKAVRGSQQILPFASDGAAETNPEPASPTCYTLGHSTRSLAEFLEILAESGIRRVLDVRRFPGSRRFPQFNSESLAGELNKHGIEYRHLAELGGRRRASAASAGGYWRTEGFRGFSEYMRTPEFRKVLDNLMALAGEKRSAIICSEAVPWRCHRQLISDALVLNGMPVTHLMSVGKRQAHVVNDHARLSSSGEVIYLA